MSKSTFRERLRRMKEGWKKDEEKYNKSIKPIKIKREDIVSKDGYITCPRCDGEPEKCILDTDICICGNTGRVKEEDYN